MAKSRCVPCKPTTKLSCKHCQFIVKHESTATAVMTEYEEIFYMGKWWIPK